MEPREHTTDPVSPTTLHAVGVQAAAGQSERAHADVPALGVVLTQDGSPIVLPSASDPVVAGAVTIIGGPPGRHARIGERRFWTPMRVIVALVLLTCTFGFIQKAPCRNPASWVNQHQYTRVCYNDFLPLYGGEGLAAGERPFLDHKVEYPVLLGAIMDFTARVVRPTDTHERNTRFVDVTMLLMSIGALVTGICVAKLSGRRVWDGAMFALAPGLLLGGFINWDLAAAALALGGLLAWSRKHPILAGALLGLGGATKLYPLLLLIPLTLTCLRAGKIREIAGVVFGAGAAWLAVNLPIALIAPQGWAYFYTFSRDRPADWGSVWYVVQTLHGAIDPGLPAGAAPANLNLLVAVTFIAGLIGVTALAILAPRRPRLPQLMFLTIAAFCLSNKVYSPQYVVWLLPLAVLARPRWRGFLLWQAGEVVAFFGIWYYLIHITNSNEGIGNTTYFLTLLARDGLLMVLCALVVRDALHPERDVVRADGADDPAGGVLEHAPDADWFTRVRGTIPGVSLRAATPTSTRVTVSR